MSVIKVIGRNKLNKVLEKVNLKNCQFMLISYVIKRKYLPKEAFVLKAKYLVPQPSVIQSYFMNGFDDPYIEAYEHQLKRPEQLFQLNDTLLKSFTNESDLFLVNAEDEEENYHYLSLLSNFIYKKYGIKVISSKNYLKGESSKLRFGEKKIINSFINNQTLLINKLKEMNLDPTKILLEMIPNKDIGKLDDKYKKIYHQMIEDRKWEID